MTYVNLCRGSGTSRSNAHQETANVQHGFVFTEMSEAGDEEAANEDDVMANESLFPSVIFHRFVDEQRAKYGPEHREGSCSCHSKFH